VRYTAIDCFSGAGGLSLGLINAGFEILLSFDNNLKCIQTQNSNPKYFNHLAVAVSVEELLNGELLRRINISRGELFLLAGGPPCQGFSIQRIGEDKDIRNDLVLKFIQLINEVYPRYFIMENVPGITGKRGKSILDELMNKTADMGYWIHKQIIDAQDFLVPQRRKRVFIVGERVDGLMPMFQFPDRIAKQKLTVRDTIGFLPPPPEDGTDHPDIIHHRKDRLSEINVKRLRSLKQGQGRDYLPEELLVNAHKISSALIGHRNVYGRMSWDSVAPTITARFDSFTRGQFGHPEQMRSITLREGALLQTFPIDFIFSGTKVDIARQIGNAVPPILGEILGRQIINSFQEKLKLTNSGG
jgi:DNA (cytosine-5)-methyltransferase 1